MDRKINLAVIGTGRMGSVHVRNVARLVPEANLVAICDIRLEAAQPLAEELGIPRVVKDYHELLADKSIEAVLIATSTDTHDFIVRDAAQAGKHIFCEKPLALDLKKINDALAAVKSAGVKLQVGFNRRFDKSFRKVHEVVASGEIGRPCIFRITNRDPDFPAIEFMRVSGGMFLDMTIHDFDMVRFLSGSEAEEIYTMGAILVDPEIGRAGDVDTCVVTMRLANGALATIDNSRKAVYGYDQRVEVFGSAGMVAVLNRTPDTHVHFAANGVHSATPLYFFLERYADAYVAEMQEFVRCVQAGATPPVTGRDGLVPVIMGLAATRSLKEGRPVRLDEIR